MSKVIELTSAQHAHVDTVADLIELAAVSTRKRSGDGFTFDKRVSLAHNAKRLRRLAKQLDAIARDEAIRV